MKKLILIILTCISFLSYGQDLTCEDFKEGTFLAEITVPIKFQWKIIREGNSQTEVFLELPEELKGTDYPTNPKYGILEWIDDCTYKLTYDESKSDLTDSQKLVNNLGGLINKFIKVEGNCFYYKSTLKYDGGEQTMDGKYCKE